MAAEIQEMDEIGHWINFSWDGLMDVCNNFLNLENIPEILPQRINNEPYMLLL